MRLWTVHPRYLDAKGLVAAWREALLAQKVLAGGTSGYRNHPQLIRFKMQAAPAEAMAAFLTTIAEEAAHRGYCFDSSKIPALQFSGQIKETDGQLLYEWEHLKRKLKVRAPDLYRRHADIATPEPHPLFKIIKGNIRDWEKHS